MWCLFFVLLLVFTTPVKGTMKFTSTYGGTSVYGAVGSSVQFTWNFSGGVGRVAWGIKKTGITNDISTRLVFLSTTSPIPTIAPPTSYNGRVSGIITGSAASGQVVFTLSNIQMEDEVFYGCQLLSTDLNPVTPFDSVRLIVEAKPNITHPTAASESVNEGSHVNISCTATGKRDADVRWIHTGQDKVSGSRTVHLVFNQITKKDAGIYTCRANNSAGSTEKKMNLIVNYAPEGTSIALSKYTAVQGDTVTLTCVVNATNPPVSEYRFYHNGSDTATYTGTDTNNFTISDVQRSQHNGKYRCVAHNSVGDGQSDEAVLLINVRVTIQPFLQNTTVTEGSPVILNCDASGYPPPSVIWRKDGRQMSQTSVLNIASSNKSNSGRYVCIASNIVGKQDMETFVTVNYPASITRVLPQSPHESWATKTLNFTCEAIGVPAPTIIWKRPGGSEIARLVGSQNIVAVQMQNEADFGQYTCEANNDVGSAVSRTILVKQIKPPGSPSITIQVEDIMATSVLIQWTAPADVGGSAITAYRVVILHENNVLRNETTDGTTTKYFAEHLTKNTTYTLRVSAMNKIFEGSASEKKVTTKFEGAPATAEIVDLPAETESTEVTIKWNEPQNNGAPITQYAVYQRLVNDDGTVGEWKKLNEFSYPSKRQVVVKLDKNTVYEFVVTARNRHGESLREGMNIRKLTVLGGKPEPVVFIVESRDDEITITWEVPKDNGAAITKYSIYKRTAKGEEWEKVIDIKDMTTTMYDLKVEKGKTYEFVMSATNKHGESAFNDENIKTVTVSAGKGTSGQTSGGIDTAVVAGAAAAGVLLVIGLILLLVWWKRRKNSSEAGSSAADLRGVNPDELEDGYHAVGAPSAARQLQAGGRVPDVTYAEVDKSSKKNRPQVTDVYAQVDKAAKKTRKKRNKQPGELEYAELDDFRRTLQPPAAQPSGAAALVRAPRYEGTVYADISEFSAPQPEPTYDNVPKKDVVYSNVESM